MGYTNSPLVIYTKLSPNHSGQRTHAIDRITPHCVVGQCSVETLGNIFASTERQASCNYGIGADGRVGMYCEEKNCSWCSSSSVNDQRAITIECASDTTAPYAFKDVVYNELIELCVDICKRNGKTKLIWFGDKDKTLAYNPAANEMVLTVHRWFANKSCPGDWMYQRMGDLANKVNEALSKASGWVQDENGWWYRNEDGSYPKNQWLQLDAWYYFNEEGYAECNGWRLIDNKWYYFNSDCKMETGWLELDGKWYYLDQSGAMVTGTQIISGQTYHFANDGHMCRTNESGALV